MSKALIIALLSVSFTVNLCYGQTPCTLGLNNAIRLNAEGVFSSTSGAGRVEICVCSDLINSSCFWQTVSTGSPSEPLSWKNSIVVCRELGYFDVQSPIVPNTVSSGNHASPLVGIFPSTFNCGGTENALSECVRIGGSFDSHLADAYITCQTTAVTGKIRLTGTTDAGDGVVEYYSSNAWRTICPDFWADDEANTLCVSLGYERGTATLYSISSFGANVYTSPSISMVSCSGTEAFFTSCTITRGSSCASLTTLAGVECESDTTLTEGSVRLYDTGSFSGYSRVEVFYHGRWGTVCDTEWEIDDGQVACRELNRDIDQTLVPPSTSVTFSSTSSRPIWILGYNCDGSEDDLRSCSRPSFPVGFVGTSCTHSSDAGLICAQPATSSSGGLSGGAIAGIVIGSIFFLGLVGWGITALDKKKKTDAARRHQQQERQAREQRERQAREQREREERERQAREQTTNTSSSTTAIEMTTTNSNFGQYGGAGLPPADSALVDSIPTSHPNSELTNQAAPPSYNEALHHLNVQTPPEYPDKEKKLPYPQEPTFNPAYPPAPSAPTCSDYQGYPPPTQPYPPGFLPGMPVQDPSAPYPPPPGVPGASSYTTPYPP